VFICNFVVLLGFTILFFGQLTGFVGHLIEALAFILLRHQLFAQHVDCVAELLILGLGHVKF
jgi:hypothetical protein